MFIVLQSGAAVYATFVNGFDWESLGIIVRLHPLTAQCSLENDAVCVKRWSRRGVSVNECSNYK